MMKEQITVTDNNGIYRAARIKKVAIIEDIDRDKWIFG
jgi:hypothetical protein